MYSHHMGKIEKSKILYDTNKILNLILLMELMKPEIGQD